MTQYDDVAAAARMVALAMTRGKSPARSGEYARLVRRFDTEPDFAQLVRKVAQGFDLTVQEVHPQAGLVLATTTETDFAVSVTDLVPNAENRPLYLLAHLAIASRAFPRPEDLDVDEHVARVSVQKVDEDVRAYATVLERRAAAADEDTDPPADSPGLEGLWRAYLRRNPTGRTGKDRTPRSATYALVRKAFTHLEQRGFVRATSEEEGGTYATNVLYRLHIRDQAAREMLQELATLGVAALPHPDAPLPSEAPEQPDATDHGMLPDSAPAT
ncbi:hypothetical protein ACGFYY_36570 [Streptomyces sp. NPDC048331]|uniref:hypothetical protein n=1 Tax=Streptomyces sp. NPDC048331 TaxID=3365534 RepID=UPI003722765E